MNKQHNSLLIGIPSLEQGQEIIDFRTRNWGLDATQNVTALIYVEPGAIVTLFVTPYLACPTSPTNYVSLTPQPSPQPRKYPTTLAVVIVIVVAGDTDENW